MTVHGPARINPDAPGPLAAAVAFTALLALVSFLMSYAGLSAASEWANVPAWLSWGVPVYIDGAILVYTLAALIHRARAESARMAWSALAIFATLSVAANTVHAWDGAPDAVRTGIGMLIAGLAPVAVLLTTHTIARLIIAPPAPAPELAPVTPWRERLAAPSPPPSKPVATDHLSAPREPRAPRATSTKSTAASTAARDARIRELAAQGAMGVRDIGAEVGVSKSTVSRVLNAATPALV